MPEMKREWETLSGVSFWEEGDLPGRGRPEEMREN